MESESMPLSSWDEFKSTCIVRKNLNNQYRPAPLHPGGYDLFGPEPGFSWSVTIVPGVNDADIADFEANHKSNFNWPVGQRAYAFATADYEFMPNMAQESCPAGGSKSVLFKIVENCRLNGGKLVVDANAAFGDWVECALVDHDNLLQYGVDTVLKAWIPKWGVDWKAGSDSIEVPYAGIPPVGMYLRFTYHSVGATPVGFIINYLLHRPI